MKEIEIKFRVKSFGAIRTKLKKLGARLDWKGLEESFYYKVPGCMLRIRSWKGHSTTITLKTPLRRASKKYKSSNEYQVRVDDMRTAREIMKNLGYKEYLHHKKRREHWKSKDASIELDIFEGIYFVEIEASKKRIDELAKKLNLNWKDSTTEGYLRILKQLRR